jgi:hypothetical protein
LFAIRAHGQRDRPFDRLDDVGEADLGRRPRQREAAAGAARAGQQAGAASWPISFCAVGSGTPVSCGKLGRADSRAPAGGGRRRSSSRPHNRQGG